jgi:5-methylcytosine-specific restriction endonuclease McrA
MSDNRIQLIAKLHKIQGGLCFIGEEPLDLAKDKLEIDHIIPRAKGGKDDECSQLNQTLLSYAR